MTKHDTIGLPRNIVHLIDISPELRDVLKTLMEEEKPLMMKEFPHVEKGSEYNKTFSAITRAKIEGLLKFHRNTRTYEVTPSYKIACARYLDTLEINQSRGEFENAHC